VERPELLEGLGDFDDGALYDFQARAAWGALCNLVARGVTPSWAEMACELGALGYVSAVDGWLGWLPGFRARAAEASPARVAGWAASLVRLSLLRERALTEELA
jgi:hypothetical protein